LCENFSAETAKNLLPTVNPKNQLISKFIFAAALEGTTGDSLPAHRHFPTIVATNDTFPSLALATARYGRHLRRQQLPVALQATFAVSQNETPATTRIAGKALSAHFARHVTQATARLIANRTSGEQW